MYYLYASGIHLSRGAKDRLKEGRLKAEGE